MAAVNTLQTPSATLPTGAGTSAPNPAWQVLVNQAHENAHNQLQATRNQRHAQGKQAFVSVPRPPDTQSY